MLCTTPLRSDYVTIGSQDCRTRHNWRRWWRRRFRARCGLTILRWFVAATPSWRHPFQLPCGDTTFSCFVAHLVKIYCLRWFLAHTLCSVNFRSVESSLLGKRFSTTYLLPQRMPRAPFVFRLQNTFHGPWFIMLMLRPALFQTANNKFFFPFVVAKLIAKLMPPHSPSTQVVFRPRATHALSLCRTKFLQKTIRRYKLASATQAKGSL